MPAAISLPVDTWRSGVLAFVGVGQFDVLSDDLADCRRVGESTHSHPGAHRQSSGNVRPLVTRSSPAFRLRPPGSGTSSRAVGHSGGWGPVLGPMGACLQSADVSNPTIAIAIAEAAPQITQACTAVRRQWRLQIGMVGAGAAPGLLAREGSGSCL